MGRTEMGGLFHEKSLTIIIVVRLEVQARGLGVKVWKPGEASARHRRPAVLGMKRTASGHGGIVAQKLNSEITIA